MAGERSRVRRMLVRAAELSVAFGFVVLCFVIFLGVLGQSFPRGTSLGDLMGYATRDHARGPAEFEVSFDDAEVTQRLPLVASLSRVLRRVKDRSAATIVWQESQAGQDLRQGHSVQTFSRSGATIAFEGKHTLRLEERSLIVLRGAEVEPETRRKHAALVLLEGTLGARLVSSSQDEVALDIASGDGRFEIASRDRAPADFRVQVNADRSTTYAVFEGQGSVSAAGRTVTVEPDHTVTVLPGQPPGLPVRLVARPVPVAPSAGDVRRFRETAAEVRFAWEAQPDAESYVLRVARDPEFADVVHVGQTRGNEARHGYLKDGEYFWRVSAVGPGGEGPPCAPRRLSLVRDTDAPALRLDVASGIVPSAEIRLRGTTEPGVRLLVADRPVAVGEDGSFHCDVPLDRGLNVVVVESVDEAGNMSYESVVLNAKPEETLP